jgi:hypothetical protein
MVLGDLPLVCLVEYLTFVYAETSPSPGEAINLVAGPVIGITGKLAPDTTGTSTSTTGTAAQSSNSKTNTLAHLEWSSKHFGSDSWSHFDFNFGGALGIQSALSLLTNPPDASGTTTPSGSDEKSVTPQYQPAFVWDIDAQGNLHIGTSSEASAFVRVRQTRLLSGNGATVVDQGANSTLQIPLNSNADQMAWFWESVMELSLYGKSLEVIHAEKGQLDPMFKIGLSYKRENRFKQSAGLIGFDSPDKRMVFRFMVNGLKVIDRRSDVTASKPYTISFGIEHERGFGNHPVPSGTQIIIRGDINLLKLLNPSLQ